MCTLSVRPSWTPRSVKAAQVWILLILELLRSSNSSSSSDLNDLHAHTACCPPSPLPPHPLPLPIIKSVPLLEDVERKESGGRGGTSERHFAQPSLFRLHCYNNTAKAIVFVIIHSPSVIRATLETGVLVATAFRAPVFPVLKLNIRYHISCVYMKVLFRN